MDTDNKYGVLEIQKGLLVLLKKFDGFCQEYNIKYTLDSGSLLGAVRHKGFIPWDDDIDIVVDRRNYELIKKSIKASDDLDFFTDLWMPRIQLKNRNTSFKDIPTLDVLFK